MPAQNLPPLEKDGSIVTGQLQNGITYYLASNPRFKGVADFALVMRGRPDTSTIRKKLSSLPHFTKTLPYEFLSRKGIGCGPEGYISYPDGATIYRFHDVQVIDQKTSDSTMLMMFDIIDSEPCQYAVIVSGDINVQNLINRMTVFSMSVSKRNPLYSKPSYSWVPSRTTSFSHDSTGRTTLALELRSPRTPDGLMNTIQPFLTQVYMSELMAIIRNRISETFVSRDVPLRTLSVDYVGSADTFGDERLKIGLEVAQGKQIQATIGLSAVIAELAARGVSSAEYKVARQQTLKQLLVPEENSVLVDRCIASYLHGADLAKASAKIDYINSRNMNIDSELKFFNEYIKVLLSSPENMSVSWGWSEPGVDDWTREMAFSMTWNSVSQLDKPQFVWLKDEGDTLDFGKGKSRAKLRSSTYDPSIEGEIWTFSNGMKVIFRNMPSPDNQFSYSLFIRNGYSSVKGLKRGEGAFYSDMLWLYDIAGMRGRDFRKVLKANDVEMNANVTLSDMRISGSAPSDKLKLVLKALLSVANDRTLNEEAFKTYRKTEYVKLSPANLDSLLYPNYPYSAVKTTLGLTEKVQADANSYFEREFLRVDDGFLVIAGNLSRKSVQNVLSYFIGGFKVSRMRSDRPVIQYRYGTGDVTYSSSGYDKRVEIGMVAALPYTTENNMAFLIASMQMGKALSGVMASNGFSLSMSPSLNLYPTESAEAIFHCLPVPEEGLPFGVETGSKHPMQAVAYAKMALNDVLEMPIDEPTLAAFKTLLKTQYSERISDRNYYIEMVLLRSAYGKDILTNWQNRIDNTSAERVNIIKDVLSEGFRIEYVVK